MRIACRLGVAAGGGHYRVSAFVQLKGTLQAFFEGQAGAVPGHSKVAN
jgi:hypothetical protein